MPPSNPGPKPWGGVPPADLPTGSLLQPLRSLVTKPAQVSQPLFVDLLFLVNRCTWASCSQVRGITLDLGFSSFVVPLPAHIKAEAPEYDAMQFTLVMSPTNHRFPAPVGRKFHSLALSQ